MAVEIGQTRVDGGLDHDSSDRDGKKRSELGYI